MKNKKVVLYGAGILLEVILTYFNLRDLDIIAIADKKFAGHEEGEMFYGYKVCSPEEVMDLNPDMVLISLKQYCKVADYLINVLYKKSKIKVKLLVRKSFWSLLKECIWA